MDIIWKIKSCFLRKPKLEYDGFELQDWETFGLPKSETDCNWLGKLLATTFTIIVASFVRFFNEQPKFIQEVFLPQFILIVVAGILIVYNLLEFRIRPLVIYVFFGLLIIFL